METLSKNSLSFCQEDEPASDEFCSIIRLSIQFILDELSVLGRQYISSQMNHLFVPGPPILAKSLLNHSPFQTTNKALLSGMPAFSPSLPSVVVKGYVLGLSS